MSDPAFSQVFGQLALATSEGGQAVRSALSSLEDGGATWVERAEIQLRQALADGNVWDLGELARTILAVRWALGSGGVDARVARRHPALLARSILAVVEGAPEVPELFEVQSNAQTRASFRWAASIWLAVAAACNERGPVGGGGSDRSPEAAIQLAEQAREISGPLDPHTRFTTQLLYTCTCYLAGRSGRVPAELAAAIDLLDLIDEHRDQSSAWLALAKVLFEMGAERDGLRAARQAMVIDPHLASPIVFLARQAVMGGHLDEASLLLGESSMTLVVELERACVEIIRRRVIPLHLASECYWILQLPMVEEVVSQLLAFAEEHRSCPPMVTKIAWRLALGGRAQEAVQLFHKVLNDTTNVEVVRLARDGLAQVGSKPEVSALELLLYRGSPLDGGSVNLFVSADPEIFWSRCATMDGRLDAAWELLERAEANASTSSRLAEIRREKRLIEGTRRGTLPLPLVSEFLWIRERPLTSAVVTQLLGFVDEHRGAVVLRELLAWDLAVAGLDDEARRQFQSTLVLAGADLELQQSVALGLAFLGEGVPAATSSSTAQERPEERPRKPPPPRELPRTVIVARSEEQASMFASALRGGAVGIVVGRPAPGQKLPPHRLLVCEGSSPPAIDAAAQALLVLPALDLETVSSCLQHEQVRHLAALRAWRPTLVDVAQKLASKDPLGVERYLPASVAINRRSLSTYQDRCRALEEVESHAKRRRGSGFVRRAGVQVVEELVMNAMYHAPVDADGKKIFEDVETNARVQMTTPSPVSLAFAVHERALYVAVRDRFGSFDPAALKRCLDRCLTHSDQIEQKKLGAGLGLYQILSTVSRLTINVIPGRLSEFIAVVEPRTELPNLSSLSMMVG